MIKLMLIIHVHVHVKPDRVADFIQATIENASNSVREPGIARFDVMQQSDDATRFVLIEVYRSDDAPGRHRETAHYAKWRDTVADMMAEPRSRAEFRNVFPADQNWQARSSIVRFEFTSAGRIIFGPGAVSELPDIAGAFGRRVLIVTGRDRLRYAGL